MRISGHGMDEKNNYMERVQTGRDSVGESGNRVSAEQAGQAEKAGRSTDRENGFPPIKDAYIDSEKAGRSVKGLYRMGQDENGNPKVLYEEPEKGAAGKGAAKEAEECTGRDRKSVV